MRHPACLLSLTLLVPATAFAQASTPDELRADWDIDKALVGCAYDAASLQEAAEATSDAAYRAALQAELAKVGTPACGPNTQAFKRGTNPFAGVKVTGVQAKGKGLKERVTLTNVSGQVRTITAQDLSPYQLRIRSGRAGIVQFDDARLELEPGDELTLRWTCAPGARVPKQVGLTAYLCLLRGRKGVSRLEVLPDRGGVVDLVDASRDLFLSTYGYGTKRTTPRL